MAGLKSNSNKAPEPSSERDAEWPQGSRFHRETDDHGHSDDERSIAGDSWSVKSEYGSTLDGDDSRAADIVAVMTIAEDGPLGNGALSSRRTDSGEVVLEEEEEPSMPPGMIYQPTEPRGIGHVDSAGLGSAQDSGLVADVEQEDPVMMKQEAAEGTGRGFSDAKGTSAQGTSRVQKLEGGEEEEDEEQEEDDEDESSVLGLKSHWDSTYAQELHNFEDHGEEGEVWFGEGVMDTMAEWTARIAASTAATAAPSDAALSVAGVTGAPVGRAGGAAGPSAYAHWSVLDVGTGNGLLLHALAGYGFTRLCGTDYSADAVKLARSLADQRGLSHIRFEVDDVLHPKVRAQQDASGAGAAVASASAATVPGFGRLSIPSGASDGDVGGFHLITDKGTLDAIRLHPEGKERSHIYRLALLQLLRPSGLLVVTSCNSTMEELIQELAPQDPSKAGKYNVSFEYLDHVQTYPKIRFGGMEGSRVATVAFLKVQHPKDP